MDRTISRRTKTGNYLTLIQGEALGTGIATGQLYVVSQDETERELRKIELLNQNETAKPVREWTQREYKLTRFETLLSWLGIIKAS